MEYEHVHSKDIKDLMLILAYIVKKYGSIPDGHIDQSFVLVDKQGFLDFFLEYQNQKVVLEVTDVDEGRWYRIRRDINVQKILNETQSESNKIS